MVSEVIRSSEKKIAPPAHPVVEDESEETKWEDTDLAREEAAACWARAKDVIGIQAEVHLGARPWLGEEKRKELLDLVKKEDRQLLDDADYLQQYINAPEVLERFLYARDNEVLKAKRLLIQALEWRRKRRPDLIDYAEMEREARTGKVRVAEELDIWGRAIVIFDNSVQNTRDPEANMRFLAFNLSHALRRMHYPISKYVVFMHLSHFSLANNPSWSVTKETLLMLVCAFAECCGHIVLHGAPGVFRMVYNACKPFIDPVTATKIIFIPNSPQADDIIVPILGPKWKELTGVGFERESPHSSPGYRHTRHWTKTLLKDRDWRRHTKNFGALAHTLVNWPGPDQFRLDASKIFGQDHNILESDLLELCDDDLASQNSLGIARIRQGSSSAQTPADDNAEFIFDSLKDEDIQRNTSLAGKHSPIASSSQIALDIRLILVLAGGLVCCAIVALTTSIF